MKAPATLARQPRAYLTFLKEYCRNYRQIGAIAPDSRPCVNAMFRYVPFRTANLILEFGAASGAVTRRILLRKRPDAVLVSFEKNPSFYRLLNKNVSGDNFFPVQEDVFDSARVLGQIGLSGFPVDCVISTLPCSFLDFEGLLEHAVLPLLAPGGVFVQYLYSLSTLRGYRLSPRLRNYFENIHSRFVLLNLPPVLIYSCTR